MKALTKIELSLFAGSLLLATLGYLLTAPVLALLALLTTAMGGGILVARTLRGA